MNDQFESKIINICVARRTRVRALAGAEALENFAIAGLLRAFPALILKILNLNLLNESTAKSTKSKIHIRLQLDKFFSLSHKFITFCFLQRVAVVQPIYLFENCQQKYCLILFDTQTI